MPLVVVIDIGAKFPDAVEIDKAELRNKLREIDRRLGALPDGYALYNTGELIALDDDGFGPAPVSQGTVMLSLGGRAIGRYRPKPIPLGDALTLRDESHCGFKLIKVDAAACVVSCEPHPDPKVGVLEDFHCVFERYNGAGPIQVVSSLTNQHEAGHTTVSNNGAATLMVDVARGVWCLHGKTEA